MLEVKGLCKSYGAFALEDASFSLPDGCIMGFIGQNGAGKTTTIKSIMNLVRPDAGSVKIFGLDMEKDEIAVKQQVGYLAGPVAFYQYYTVARVVGVYKRFYSEWSDDAFEKYTKSFGIDAGKKISTLSTGMKTKLGLALALSHNAKLLILDEPTSGLDPVARDELLDIFRDVVADGERSILFSTHITSDLDKCADLVTFIRQGKIIFSENKDEITDAHFVIKGRKAELTTGLKSRIIGCKVNSTGFTALIRRNTLTAEDSFAREKPTLEDIMVYYNKEGGNEKSAL